MTFTTTNEFFVNNLFDAEYHEGLAYDKKLGSTDEDADVEMISSYLNEAMKSYGNQNINMDSLKDYLWDNKHAILEKITTLSEKHGTDMTIPVLMGAQVELFLGEEKDPAVLFQKYMAVVMWMYVPNAIKDTVELQLNRMVRHGKASGYEWLHSSIDRHPVTAKIKVTVNGEDFIVTGMDAFNLAHLCEVLKTLHY